MRVSGVIGYGEQRETRPGVVEDVITERPFRGDILRPPASGPEDSGNVNDDLRVNVTISVVAGAYHNQHVHDIRYITWQGNRWKVSNVDVVPPRLNMRLGGIYNGDTPRASDTP